MQATITYLLTEQAQRAQMAATGQPITRKQQMTVEVPAEDMDLYDVAEDGTVTLNLADSSSRQQAWLNGRCVAPIYAFAEIQTPESIAKLFRERIAAVKREKQEATERQAREKAEQTAKVESYIDAFLTDPEARGSGPGRYNSHGAIYHYEGKISHTASGFTISLEGSPRAQMVVAEIERRNTADREKAAADKAAKEAADAAKEQAKLDFLRTWIAEHGTPSQSARSAEGLLPRDEAITALADATFAPLAQHEYNDPQLGKRIGGFTRYTNASRPAPECSNEACEYGEDCKLTHSVTDSVDSLCEEQYTTYTAIRAALPDATFVLRTHTAIHDCDHSPDCHAGVNYGCMVKLTVGPFSLQREYEL